MTARIYKPAKTAMSSGQAKTRLWVLEYEPTRPLTIEPLMGYTSNDDMTRQICLTFETKEEAIDYAKRNGIAYRLFEPSGHTRPAIAYSDNFRRDRAQPWSH